MKEKIENLYKIYCQYPNVCTDTRKIEKDSLFFALKGPNFNANEYAAEALEKGASFAVIDEEKYKDSEKYILVEDVFTTLQHLAKYHRQKLQIPIIGITGSNGKTTTKELIATALATKLKTFATKGNLNNHIGVPLSLLSITSAHEVAIIEMGANHIGEIKSLCEIAQPNYGIITNIGKAHLEGFGGIEGVIKAKSELYKYIEANGGKLFVNSDQQLLMDLSANNEKITYGRSGPTDCLGNLKTSVPKVTFNWTSNFESSAHGIVSSNLFGEYNFQNLLAAVCIASYFKVDSENIDKSLSEYESKNNRSQLIKTKQNTVIMDAYNANPSSMEFAVNTFLENDKSSKIVILGDMFELGESSGEEHQKIVELVQRLSPQDAYFVGKHFFNSQKGKFNFYKTRNELVENLQKKPLKNKTIFIKGSRGIELEKLLDFIH